MVCWVIVHPMCHIVDPQVAFGGKNCPTNVACKRLLSGVSLSMSLKRLVDKKFFPHWVQPCCLTWRCSWASNKGVINGDKIEGPTNIPGTSSLTYVGWAQIKLKGDCSDLPSLHLFSKRSDLPPASGDIDLMICASLLTGDSAWKDLVSMVSELGSHTPGLVSVRMSFWSRHCSPLNHFSAALALQVKRNRTQSPHLGHPRKSSWKEVPDWGAAWALLGADFYISAFEDIIIADGTGTAILTDCHWIRTIRSQGSSGKGIFGIWLPMCIRICCCNITALVTLADGAWMLPLYGCVGSVNSKVHLQVAFGRKSSATNLILEWSLPAVWLPVQ